MNPGDYSYANYMTLEGLNDRNAEYYGFSKDNGYWEIVDKEGNYIDDDLAKTAALEIVVTDKVTVPTGKTLTYNGKAQTGVAEGELYTVTNGSKPAAGTYTATVSLKDKEK